MNKLITVATLILALTTIAKADQSNIKPDLLVCNAWLAKANKLVPISYTGGEYASYSETVDRFDIRIYIVLENGKILAETHIDSNINDTHMNAGRVEIDSKTITKIAGGLNIAGDKDYGSTVSIECRLK